MKLKISLNIFDILINIISVLIFASSYFDVMGRRTTGNSVWAYLFSYSLYTITVLCVITIWLFLHKEKRVYLSVVIMLLVFVYEVILSGTFGILKVQEIIRDNLAWILTFCSFYCYASMGRISGNTLFVQIVNTGTAVYCLLVIPNIYMHMMGMDSQGNIIAPLYYSFGFLGLVLMYSGRSTKMFFSIVISVMILLSEKRTGFLIIIIGLLLLGIVKTNMGGTRGQRIRKYMRLVIVAALAAWAGYWLIGIYNINVIDRMRLLFREGDTGSGRLIIWRLIINYFRKSSFTHKVFGYGFHAVPVLVHPLGRAIFAHNCFLEILFDFGYVGLAFILAAITWCSVTTLKMFWWQHKWTPIMAYALVVILLLSMFGYFFEESRFIMPIMMICGICLGTWHEDRMECAKSSTGMR